MKTSSAGTYAKSGIGEYGGRCEIIGRVALSRTDHAAPKWSTLFVHCRIDCINTSLNPLWQPTRDRTSKPQFLQRQENSSRAPLFEEPGRPWLMFSKFGSGSVQPRQIFQIWLVAVRFEPNFENIIPGVAADRPWTL